MSLRTYLIYEDVGLVLAKYISIVLGRLLTSTPWAFMYGKHSIIDKGGQFTIGGKVSEVNL